MVSTGEWSAEDVITVWTGRRLAGRALDLALSGVLDVRKGSPDGVAQVEWRELPGGSMRSWQDSRTVLVNA